MKSFFSVIVLTVFPIICYAQCWVGTLKNDANLFSEPSSDSEVVMRLKEACIVILDETSKSKGYYEVYSVDDKQYGFVASHNIDFVKEYDCDDAEATLELVERISNDDYDDPIFISEEDDSSVTKEERFQTNHKSYINNNLDTSKFWLGMTTEQVNLREQPSTNNTPITIVPKGSAIAFDSSSLENGFYYVLFIDKDLYGYVSQKYVERIKEIKEEHLNLEELYDEFIEGRDPELHIRNSANVAMTLRVNDKVNYPFKAHEKRIITVPPGKVHLYVSSPGTIPYNGITEAKSGHSYGHTFYLKSSHVKK